MDEDKGTIAGRIRQLQQSIARHAERVGRDPHEIRFLLVSKTVSPEKILEAYEVGIRDFGENRVQELEEKRGQLPADIRWHMIGHLQTNKVKQVLPTIRMLHSLDRPKLYEALLRAMVGRREPLDCLLQVNSSGEASKHGFKPEEVADFVAGLEPASPLRLRGLMTIGPFTENQEAIRQAFRITRQLRDCLVERFPQYDWGILSMGMSGDYGIAIEEGANLLRVGSLIFGERETARK